MPLCVGAQDDGFRQTVKKSGFIFIGTVEALGQATASVPVRPNSAIVRVDSVIEALPPIGNPTGQRVTVYLRDRNSVSPGHRAAFFTYLQAAGKTLGLVELAHESPSDTLAQRVREARQGLADAALRQRLNSATLVVVGKVGKPAAVKPSESGGGGEHDPYWWRAPVTVETFEKGRAADRTVAVHFATNADYLWYEAPKLKEGEQAILLLQPPPKNESAPGYYLIDRNDKLPVGELDHVRNLLKAP